MTTSREHKRATPRTRGINFTSASLLAALAAGLIMAAAPAHARHLTQVGLIERTWEGVAIKGYDPVAYFEMGRAVEGSEAFVHEWLGQEWRFVDAAPRDLFSADPIKYVPQYGGYCSDSHNTANINPTAWRIVGGRLYLFYSEASADSFAYDDRAQSTAEKYWQTVKTGLSQ